jgi:DNA-binding transcriptional regulator LsrR (DeoR family)
MFAPGGDESEGFLTRLAWLYFVGGMTQAGIAEQLGITRLRVNRGIALARTRGLVRVELESPFAAAIALETQLTERFGLRDAFVGIADRSVYDPHVAVGTALAAFLDDGLGRGIWSSIGVSWGKTVEHAVRGLRPRNLPAMEIISMIGGTMLGRTFNSFGVAANLARRLGARHSILAAPIYFETRALAEAVLASAPFAEQIRKAIAVDVAILVTGDLSEQSYLVRDGLPATVSPAELAAQGAVGDVLGQFLDRQGRVIDHPINRRVMGVPVEALAGMRHVVLAAAGSHKVEVMLANLRGGFVHTLVTDDVTAELLLGAPP